MKMRVVRRLESAHLLLATLLGPFSSGLLAAELPPPVRELIQNCCIECHGSEAKKGNLDLESQPFNSANPENFARWVKIYDRVESGEMPPKKRPRPAESDVRPALAWLKQTLE